MTLEEEEEGGDGLGMGGAGQSSSCSGRRVHTSPQGSSPTMQQS